MKCCYRADDGIWVKGEIVSHARHVSIYPDDTSKKSFVIHDPEILFFGTCISVCGFQRLDEINDHFKLVCIDVSLDNPEKKKKKKT